MIGAGSAYGSAAWQDPTDGRLRAAASSAARGRSWTSSLEEAANRVACDPQGDDAGGCVDVGDRVRRDEAAVPREATRPDRQRVRDARKAPVHRTFDAADDPAPAVGDDEAGGGAEVGCDCAHRPNVFLS